MPKTLNQVELEMLVDKAAALADENELLRRVAHAAELWATSKVILEIPFASYSEYLARLTDALDDWRQWSKAPPATEA